MRSSARCVRYPMNDMHDYPDEYKGSGVLVEAALPDGRRRPPRDRGHPPHAKRRGDARDGTEEQPHGAHGAAAIPQRSRVLRTLGGARALTRARGETAAEAMAKKKPALLNSSHMP